MSCLWLLSQDKGRAGELQQKTHGPKAKAHALYKKSLLTPSVMKKEPWIKKTLTVFSGRKLMARGMKIGMDNDTPDQLWEAAGRTEACGDLASGCRQRLCSSAQLPGGSMDQDCQDL